MATEGKKKSDDRKPGAAQRKGGRSGTKVNEPVRSGAESRDDLEDEKGKNTALLVPGGNLIGPDAPLAKRAETDVVDGQAATELGATKYVHAAFFAAGILAAFISAKLLALIWGQMAEWPAAVEAVPQLLAVGEARRGTYTTVAGVIIGVLAVVQTYRKASIRKWADEVALELSRVTWPDRETVTNGTIVVVVGSTVAAVYVALLDRVWMFVTSLIYGS